MFLRRQSGPALSLFTQPAPQGRLSRFSSHSKGDGLLHPIRGSPPRQARSRRREAYKAIPCPAAQPSAAGPTSEACGVQSKNPVQLSAPPTPLRARPKVGGERCREQNLRPAAHPSDAPSGPGPNLAVRGVESIGCERGSSRSCATRRACRQPAGRKVEGVGPLLSKPVFSFFIQHNTRDGEGAEHS